MDLTFNDIQEYLGQQGKKIGQEIVFQCPYCLDKGKDNLHYNPTKNILWCFADERHSKDILSEIMKKKHEIKQMRNNEIPQYKKLQKEYLFYQQLCNDMLLGQLNEGWLDEMVDMGMYNSNESEKLKEIAHSDKPQKAREYLKAQRGINTRTIELVGLGFDFESYKWVIPIYNMNCDILGFRYRGADFKEKKVWTEKGTPKTLARFYGNDNAKTCYIVEGEFDAIVLTQWLLDFNNKDSFMVVSPSNGASSLLSVMPQLKLGQFDEIKMILDNDTAGDKATEEVIEKYPMVKDYRAFLQQSNIKDINDYYLSKVVKHE